MLDTFASIVPHTKDGAPEVLHNLIDLKRQITDHRWKQPATTTALHYPDIQRQWDTEMNALNNQFISGMRDLVSTPENVAMMLDLVDMDDRLDLVSRLLKAEHDNEALASSNPKIAAYKEWEDTNVIMRQFDRSALHEIYKDEGAVNNYIMYALGIDERPDQDTRIAAKVDMIIDGALAHAATHAHREQKPELAQE